MEINKSLDTVPICVSVFTFFFSLYLSFLDYSCVTFCISNVLSPSLPFLSPYFLPACLPAARPVCLPACQSACLPACLQVCLSACQSVCLPAYQSLSSVCLSESGLVWLRLVKFPYRLIFYMEISIFACLGVWRSTTISDRIVFSNNFKHFGVSGRTPNTFWSLWIRIRIYLLL